MTPELKIKLENAVIESLTSDYELTKEVKNPKPGKFYISVGTGVFVKGQAISFLKNDLTSYCGWSGLGNLVDFEDTLRCLGFTIKEGKNSRGNKARVVFIA